MNSKYFEYYGYDDVFKKERITNKDKSIIEVEGYFSFKEDYLFYSEKIKIDKVYLFLERSISLYNNFYDILLSDVTDIYNEFYCYSVEKLPPDYFVTIKTDINTNGNSLLNLMNDTLFQFDFDLQSSRLSTYISESFYSNQLLSQDYYQSENLYIEGEKSSSDTSWLGIVSIIAGSTAVLGGAGYWYYQRSEEKNEEKGVSDEPIDISLTTQPIESIETIKETPQQNNTLTSEENIIISGQVTLGPVIAQSKLSVEIISNKNELLSVVPLKKGGTYEVPVNKSYEIIKSKVVDADDSPDYIDESTGLPKDLTTPMISVIVIKKGDMSATMHINPLTTLVSRLMGVDSEGNSQSLTVDTIKKSNNTVAKAFLNQSDIDISSYDVNPIITENGGIIQGNEGGNVLAMISALEEKNNQTTNEVIQQLTDGFAEGDEGQISLSTESTQLLQDAVEHIAEKLDNTVNISMQQQIELIAEVNNVSINLAPRTDNLSIALNEDGVYNFTHNDFYFSDGNKDDTLTFIRITRLPDKGLLKLGTDVVTQGQLIQASDITALQFVPEDHGNGSAYTEFNYKVSDGSIESFEATVFIDVVAVDDSPIIEGMSEGVIHEDADIVSISGQLTITDPDINEDRFIARQVDGVYGVLSIQTDGQWIYTLNNDENAVQALPESGMLTDTLSITTADGTENSVTMTIQGRNDEPQITGVLTFDLTEDDTVIATGQIMVTDTDTDESVMKAVTIDGNYGELTLAVDGHWTYTLNHHHTDVQALALSETLTDTITVESFDGTTQVITLTIIGANDAPILVLSDATGSVSEMDGGVDLTLSGTLSFTDVDHHDSHTVMMTNPLAVSDNVLVRPTWA